MLLNEIGEVKMGTVLVVDDSNFVRVMISKTIIAHGHKVIEAGNGVEAIEKYKDHMPDLVFLDITMPILDGFGALQGIMNFNSNAKVVMLTNNSSEEIIQDALKLGAKLFLVKPVETDKLELAIKELI